MEFLPTVQHMESWQSIFMSSVSKLGGIRISLGHSVVRGIFLKKGIQTIFLKKGIQYFLTDLTSFSTEKIVHAERGIQAFVWDFPGLQQHKSQGCKHQEVLDKSPLNGLSLSSSTGHFFVRSSCPGSKPQSRAPSSLTEPSATPAATSSLSGHGNSSPHNHQRRGAQAAPWAGSPGV